MIEKIYLNSNVNMYSLSRHISRYCWTNRILDDKLKGRRRPITILDLGCGSGYGTELLANIVSSCPLTIIGVDQDKEAIAYAKKYHKKVQCNKNKIVYKCQSIKKFLNQLESVDWIVAFEILEHLEEMNQVLQLMGEKCQGIIGSIPYKEKKGNKYHQHFGLTEQNLLKPMKDYSILFWKQDNRAYSPINTKTNYLIKNLLFLIERKNERKH